ncbi:spermidine synthase [Thioalkalivibrio denitrificans]|uniref:Polyamine aminopropyltransferase n=1 Tax=Thioalkalivibrio denitrificans TaxID=108003 RepID=A0A1V3NRW4_9GAMM|nr:polyamine aminopropyltransferase [Thioalkalivibrio denitrificans]OOG27837.1 spermidine synthase [Thioalkalivibrio denitrificans]
MALDNHWFSEADKGLALSLRIREKLHEEQTPFQKIEIYETETFGTLMVIDGFVMLTDRDNFIYHEMMSHPVLYAHADPKNVVIIGGGDCGTLREVLKHPEVKQATQVDIDERVTRLSEKYFPELCESNDDPRARLLFDDGIRFVKDAEPGSVDVIIIDSTDPIGPAEGLFSTAFYRDCFRALGPGGMLAQQSESPLLHTDSIIRPMHDSLRTAGFLDVLALNFPQCTYPSGWWSATLACKDNTVSFRREQQAEEKPFETLYYNAAIHRAAGACPEFFRRKLYG